MSSIFTMSFECIAIVSCGLKRGAPNKVYALPLDVQ